MMMITMMTMIMTMMTMIMTIIMMITTDDYDDDDDYDLPYHQHKLRPFFCCLE